MNTPALETIVTETGSPITAAIIWLHGLGADGYDFANIVPQLQLPANIGLRFIFPHAPLLPVTINNGIIMRAWYDIYRLGDLSKEDEDGLKSSQKAIEGLIQQQQQIGIPSNKIFLAGFSQGGAVALYTGLRYPSPLGGILALSTYLPLAQHLNREAKEENRKISIWLGHGKQDIVVPFFLAEKTRDLLQQAGYKLAWHWYSIGHQICPDEIIDIGKWLSAQIRG